MTLDYKFFVDRAWSFDMGDGYQIIREVDSGLSRYYIINWREETLKTDFTWYPWLKIYDIPVESHIIPITRFATLEEAFDFFTKFKNTLK